MSAAQTIPHEDRKTYLGSHDTSAIFGLNPFQAAIDVYMEKRGLVEDELEPTERMQMGLKMQPVILDLFAEKMGCKLEGEECFVRHSEYEWLGGTPDALIKGELAGVDAKNIEWNRGDWGAEMTDEVPEYIAMQCHHLMTLLDYRVWYVAVLFGGNSFRRYRVVRDEKITDMILATDGKFWRENVQNGIQPPFDAAEGWKAYAKRMFPRDNREVRDATPEEIDALTEVCAARILRQQWEAKENIASARLATLMGETYKITSGIGNASYGTTKGHVTIDSKRLKEEAPDIYARYSKIGAEGRRMQITFKGEEA